MQEVTGCTLPIETDTGKSFSSGSRMISVGDTSIKRDSGVGPTDYTPYETGGYFIKNVGYTYIIDAATEEGLLYGSYAFLKKFFNVEFLTYDDTYIQETTTVRAYSVEIEEFPDFAIRDYYAYSVWNQGSTFGAKLNINSTSYASDARVNGDKSAYYGYYYTKNNTTVRVMSEGHTIKELLMADAFVNGVVSDPDYMTNENGAHENIAVGYWLQKPAWYAYHPSGERVNSKGYSQEEFCYTNGLDSNFRYVKQADDVALSEMSFTTKIIQICKKMILQDQERGGDAKYLMLGHGDYTAKCQCANCQALYTKYGTYSAATVIWVQEVAEEVYAWMQAEGIEKQVKFVIFAYSKSIDAPVTKNGDTYVANDERLQLNDNFVVKIAYRNCVYHSLMDTTCTENAANREVFLKWNAITRSFAIWDYTVNFNDYLWYLPNFGSIQSNYQYYKTLNVQHLLSQGAPSEYNFYEANLHQWVAAKMMWNSSLNTQTLIEEFNGLYFGAYASYVNEYRKILDDHFASLSGFHASTTDELDFKDKSKYSLTVLRNAANKIQEAIDAVQADTTLLTTEKTELINKLRSVKITPQYMALKLDLLTDEAEKSAMASEFFTSVETLGLTYMREGRVEANEFAAWKEEFNI